MIAPLLFVLLAAHASVDAGATASPMVQPALAADWVVGPAENEEYANYHRGSTEVPETLTATRHVCECDPVTLFDGVQAAIKARVPDATFVRSIAMVCGVAAQHLVSSGVPSAGSTTKNLDIYAFRQAGALIFISYSYSKETPTEADETSMRALCPPAAPAAP